MMKKETAGTRCFEAELAGIRFTYKSLYPGIENYLTDILTDQASYGDGVPVSVDREDLNGWEAYYGQTGAYGEFCLSCMPISEYLLGYQSCVFHAAAIQRKGKAWLIAGGSGVGKSTQCRALLDLWPGEFSVINGDKPVLRAGEDGTIMVYPSPWNGKEGLRGAGEAPLAGVFLLTRGEKNTVFPLTARRAAAGIFSSVFQSCRTSETIRLAADFSERILKACPVWQLISVQVPDSTRLLYECIVKGERTDEL